MSLLRLAALILTMLASFEAARAGGDYPARSIQLMIPASKGGGADVSFRILAEAMEPILGQKIEIVNKPADSGAEGLADLAKAAPDGYSLGGVWNGPLTASPQIRKVAYSLDSFTVAVSTFDSDYVLCAHKDFPAKTGAALVSLLSSKPLAYSYGSEGKGGSGYFAAELLFEDLGILVRGEGFDGSAEAAKKFAGKNIDFYFGTTPAIMPLIKTGQAKCLLILSDGRLDLLPEATPVRELGVPPHNSSLWRLIIAPRGLPADRILKLEAAVRKAIQAPAMQTYLAEKGERAFVHGTAEITARLREESASYSALAERLGLKPQ
jgi:tripartite-type tricarboxylate transporter receptor subunit TctC